MYRRERMKKMFICLTTMFLAFSTSANAAKKDKCKAVTINAKNNTNKKIKLYGLKYSVENGKAHTVWLGSKSLIPGEVIAFKRNLKKAENRQKIQLYWQARVRLSSGRTHSGANNEVWSEKHNLVIPSATCVADKTLKIDIDDSSISHFERKKEKCRISISLKNGTKQLLKFVKVEYYNARLKKWKKPFIFAKKIESGGKFYLGKKLSFLYSKDDFSVRFTFRKQSSSGRWSKTKQFKLSKQSCDSTGYALVRGTITKSDVQ